MRLMSALMLALVGFASFGIADEKKEAKGPMGVFKKTAGDLELTLTFKKDHKVDLLIGNGDASGDFQFKYTMEKNVVKCELENLVKKGDFPVTREKGYKFSFKLETKKGAIVLSDVEGDEIDDNAKKAIEGEYEAAKDK
jgi:hypothetical protein